MQKRKYITIILVFILCCLFIVTLFYPFTKIPSIADSQIPEDRITFTPDDGTGTIDVSLEAGSQPRLDGVYTSYYTVPILENGYFPDLSFVFGIGEVEISVDGNVLFAGRTDGAEAISSPSNISFSIASEGTEKTMVAKVRYTDPEFFILPGIALINDIQQEEKRSAAITNTAAIPAGIAGISFLIVAGLFLMSLAIPPADYSLPFLALGILCFCLFRLFCTGVLEDQELLPILRDNVLPLASEIFILIYVILNRRKKFLKYFLNLTGLLCVLILAATILNHLLVRVPPTMLALSSLVDFAARHNLNAMISLICGYLVILCMAASLVYHIRDLMMLASDRARLESNARAAMAGYEKMVDSVHETAAVRHEWKHDLLTLSLLYEQGKTEEIGIYLQEKNNFIRENEWEKSLTGCFTLDTILNFVSARAKSEHVKLTTYVNVPSDLKIKEEHLGQLLMNMFDNAFQACALMKENRFIDFGISLKGHFLSITCANSYLPSAGQRKTKDFQHGYGIRNMAKICQIYGSDLIIDAADTGVFTVKTALQLDKEE